MYYYGCHEEVVILTSTNNISQIGLHTLVRNCSIPERGDLSVQLVQRLLVRHEDGAG